MCFGRFDTVSSKLHGEKGEGGKGLKYSYSSFLLTSNILLPSQMYCMQGRIEERRWRVPLPSAIGAFGTSSVGRGVV